MCKIIYTLLTRLVFILNLLRIVLQVNTAKGIMYICLLNARKFLVEALIQSVILASRVITSRKPVKTRANFVHPVFTATARLLNIRALKI